MHDLILSWIRTAVPAAAGSLIAWLTTKGIDVDAEEAAALILAVGGACTALYQVVVSTLQRRWPVVGVLLGSTKVPVYRAGRREGVHGDLPLHRL
ncbi:hypothetical protein GCM10017673_15060 [Streptosporangium violaceochromogenes]|nr:hypothetical protein GCM10017673_15060 [Streptosporangium violaceochromogenes]